MTFSHMRTTIADRKRIPCVDGIGFTSVPDGESVITYRVDISDAGLRAMAATAAKNKCGYSVDGPLRVTITKREKVTGSA